MSREEEAEFWKTHDSTDFLENYKAVTVTRGKQPQHKCAHCGKRLLSRDVDVEVASGWAVMRPFPLRQILYSSVICAIIARLHAKTMAYHQLPLSSAETRLVNH